MSDPTRRAPRPERTIRNAILGRNAARAYRIDPDERRHAIACDAVEGLRQHHYLAGVATERESAPLASHRLAGPRTRRELLERRRGKPWSP